MHHTRAKNSGLHLHQDEWCILPAIRIQDHICIIPAPRIQDDMCIMPTPKIQDIFFNASAVAVSQLCCALDKCLYV